LFATIALVAFALPAAAANQKWYFLNMIPDAPLTVNQIGAGVTAKFDNVSPDGVSSFKSLKLYAPTGITITGATIPTGFTGVATIRNGAGAIVAEGTAVWVDVINPPVKPEPQGPSFPLKLTVNVSCSVTGNWTTTGGSPPKEQVWTGTGWTGQPFAYQGGTLATPATGNCHTLAFVNQPNNALTGQQITKVSFDPTGGAVSVQALFNGSPVAAGVSVSLGMSAGSPACAIATANATTDGAGVASFAAPSVSLKSSAGTIAGCTLTATATGYADSAPSNPFKIVAGASGVLGCTSTGNNTGGTLPGGVDQSGYEGNPDWAIDRGNNWNSEPCTLVPYVFSFNGSDGSASFLVDNGIKGLQQISAQYVLLFTPVSAVAWPAFHPKFALGSAFGVGGPVPHYPTSSLDPNDYVPALACGNDDVNDPQMPNIPSGTDPYTAEYAAAAAAGSGNPQYAPAAGQVKMCMANHGWTAMYLPAGNSFGLPAGNYIQPWYKIIDRSDGFTHQ